MRCILLVLIVVASCLSCRPAFAEPIRFIHAGRVAPESGPFAGTLGGVPFTTECFVITAIGDTNDRTTAPESFCPPICPASHVQIHHTSAAIAIDGLGTFGILSGTRTVSETSFDHVDFRLDESPPHRQLLLGGPALNRSWIFENSIGPISGFGGLAGGVPVETTGGVLFFNQADNFPVTFTAIIGVPEPAAWVLATSAALLLTLRRRF